MSEREKEREEKENLAAQNFRNKQRTKFSLVFDIPHVLEFRNKNGLIKMHLSAARKSSWEAN